MTCEAIGATVATAEIFSISLISSPILPAKKRTSGTVAETLWRECVALPGMCVEYGQ
jgi:hypothetical protein